MSEIERVFKTYDRFKYKSFQIICEMIRLLTKDFGFTNQKLLQHGYLFQTGPQSVKEILKTYPKLAGVDIKTVLYKYPKIISVPVESITAILKHLKVNTHRHSHTHAHVVLSSRPWCNIT